MVYETRDFNYSDSVPVIISVNIVTIMLANTDTKIGTNTDMNTQINKLNPTNQPKREVTKMIKYKEPYFPILEYEISKHGIKKRI